MYNILFLDDQEERFVRFENMVVRGENIAWHSSAKTALWATKQVSFDEIWLDHDLGDVSEPTGVDFAKEFVVDPGLCSPMTKFYIHSMNPVGTNNIEVVLQSAGYSVRRRPVTNWL